MCNYCQTRCGCNSGCGCNSCGNAIARALENLFSTCNSYNSCSCARSGGNGSTFGCCGSINACSDAYYARQYALVYSACCNNGCNNCGCCNSCNN